MVNLNAITSIVTSSLPTFIAVAGVVERVTELVKNVANQTTHRDIQLTPVAKEVLSLCIGCAICVCSGITLYDGLNVPLLANELFAGVIVSLGSNFLHQALNIILSVKTGIENKNSGSNNNN